MARFNDGSSVPGTAVERWVRDHGLLALLAAPLLGGLFVVLLPFIGFYLFLRVLAGKATGLAREGARDLAATVTPGWRPGEVHLTGSAMKRQGEETKAGGAGDQALEDVAREVAAKRAGEEQDG